MPNGRVNVPHALRFTSITPRQWESWKLRGHLRDMPGMGKPPGKLEAERLVFTNEQLRDVWRVTNLVNDAGLMVSVASQVVYGESGVLLSEESDGSAVWVVGHCVIEVGGWPADDVESA